MSLTHFTETIQTGDTSRTIDDKGVKATKVRVFGFETTTNDDPTDAEIQALSGFPADFDPHPREPSFLCIGWSKKRVGYRQWQVDVNYTNQPPSSKPDSGSNSSQKDAKGLFPKKSWTHEKRSVPLDVQWEKHTISHGEIQEEKFQAVGCVNSAGEPIIGGVMRDVFDPVYNYSRYEDLTDLEVRNLCNVYTGCCNLNPWMNVEPGQCRVFIEADEEIDGTRRVWHVKYKFVFRKTLHDAVVLDCGTYWLDADGKKHGFKDKDKNPLAVGPLDGNGGENPLGDNPHYLIFKTTQKADFAGLDIPEF